MAKRRFLSTATSARAERSSSRTSWGAGSFSRPATRSPDLVGPLAAQDRVDQPVELVGELVVGERVLVVAGGNATSETSVRAVVEGDGHAVGSAGGIAGGELRVLDHAGARDQVEQGGVGEPLGA